MTDESPSTLEEDFETRLSKLEEALQSPKKKTLLEQLQAYGGVFAVLIAIAYSFPLGVWEKFIDDPKSAAEQSISDMKSTISEAGQLISDINRVIVSASDPTLSDATARPLNNKLTALLKENKEKYIKNIDRLIPEEIVSLASSFQYVGDMDGFKRILELLNKRDDLSTILRAQSEQGLARSYYLPSTYRDLTKGRTLYQSAVGRLQDKRELMALYNLVIVLSDWGFYEFANGDWKCGVSKIADARKVLKQWRHAIDTQNFLAKNIDKVVANNPRPRPEQASIGCK